MGIFYNKKQNANGKVKKKIFFQNTATTGDVVVHKASGGTETFSSPYSYVDTGMAVISSINPSTVSVGGLCNGFFLSFVEYFKKRFDMHVRMFFLKLYNIYQV